MPYIDILKSKKVAYYIYILLALILMFNVDVKYRMIRRRKEEEILKKVEAKENDEPKLNDEE